MSDNSQNDETPLTPEQQENDFISILGEKNFDKAKYRLDAQKLQNIGMPLDILDPMAYKKDDDNYNDNDNDKNKNKNKNSRNTDQPDYKGDGLSFISEEKNGKLFGRGSNGETFEAKNYEELNKLIAGSYKKEYEKRPDKGKNSIVEYHTSDKNPQKMAAFAKAFINEGIAVGGDVPQDPKFWQNLKKEYLNNPEHSIDNWQHLTRKVPPQYMGEMKNEHSLSPTQATNPRAASGSFIKQLRNGNNPKLTPQQNKPQQRSNGNQPLSVQQMIGNGYQR